MSRSIMFTIATCAMLLMSFIYTVEVNADGTCSDFEGTGTEADPYMIMEPCQLDKVRDELDAHYKLAADIDLSAYNGGEWEPIARTGDGFKGSFNGDGHTISGLMINRSSDDYVGLFGKVAVSGSIRHVKLEVVNIQGKNYVGGLAGQSSGTIDNAAVSGGSVKGEGNVGGLVGRVLGVSDKETVITNSYASVNVTGSSDFQANSGGLVGILESETNSLVEITNSYASGDVDAADNGGGLVGFINNEKTQDNSTSITNSYASGNVNVENFAGGLVGYIRFNGVSNSLVEITNSYASGNVTGESQLGGLIGVNRINGSGTTSIQHVYSTGNVEGRGTIGGLIGQNQKSISSAELKIDHSYVKGKVTSELKSNWGALMGSDNDTGTTEISNSYWNSSVYEDDELEDMNSDSDLGEPKTIEKLEELMEDLTFVSWDPDLWYQFDHHPPILQWENPLISWEVSIVDASLEPGDETELQVMTTHEDDQQFEATKVSTYQLLHSGIVTLEGTTVKAVKGGKATIEATLYGEKKLLEIIVDSGAPDKPTITLDPDGWTDAAVVNVTVDHPGPDATSADIDQIRVKIGDAAWVDYEYDDLPIELEVNDDGLTVIQAQAIDVIGHVSEIATKTVKMNSTGRPMLEIELFHTDDRDQSYISGEWTNQSVTAAVYVTHDDGATLDSVTYSIDEGENWRPYDDPLTFSMEGQYALWFQGQDVVGNDLEEQLIINIDHTSPGIKYDPDGNLAPSRNVSTQVTVTDDGSGIDETQFQYIWSQSNHQLDAWANWKPFDHHNPLSLAGESGEWYLHIRAADQAGNESYAISQSFSLRSASTGSGIRARSGSSDAQLGKLTLSIGEITPAFAADVTEYSARVPNEIDQIQLNVSAADSQAEVSINGERIHDQESVSIALDEGTNTIEISVTAEDGTENVYLLTIERMEAPSSDGPHLMDITGHWAEASIVEAVDRGFIRGYPDDTFKPNQPVTRAEFTVMLANVLNLEGEGKTPDFADQGLIGGWAERAIAQAVEAGIITGYEDGAFRPHLPVTRAEMAVMVGRSAGIDNVELAPSDFADDAIIPDWAKGYVQAMRDIGIINGRGDNHFAPNDATTRAEAVVCILLLLEMLK